MVMPSIAELAESLQATKDDLEKLRGNTQRLMNELREARAGENIQAIRADDNWDGLQRAQGQVADLQANLAREQVLTAEYLARAEEAEGQRARLRDDLRLAVVTLEDLLRNSLADRSAHNVVGGYIARFERTLAGLEANDG